MTGWMIFGIVLALFFLLLFSSVRVIFRYENTEVFLQVRWLFLQYQILPEKERKPKKRHAERKQKKTPKPAETSIEKTENPAEQAEPVSANQGGEKKQKKAIPADQQSRNLKETFEMIWELIQTAKRPIKLLYRHLWVHKLDFQLVVAREDAAQTAIAYGQMNGWVYGAWAMLSNLVHMKKGRVQVLADYLSVGDRLRLSLQLRLRIVFLLAAGACFIWNFLRKLIRK